jgi:hypothetical protein
MAVVIWYHFVRCIFVLGRLPCLGSRPHYYLYTIYILSIYYLYTIYILSIYYLYTIYILSIYYLYTIYILSIDIQKSLILILI